MEAMQSKAQTVNQYLEELPPEKQATMQAVMAVVRKNLQPGIAEGMQYGMIGWFIPHGIYPPGYHCDPKQPLPVAALASQKNYFSLYLICLDLPGGIQADFREKWEKAGKKLDMGKCCLRFKKLEDLSLDLIGGLFARVRAEDYVSAYEAARAASKGVKRKAKG